MSIEGLSQYGGLYNTYAFQNIKTVATESVATESVATESVAIETVKEQDDYSQPAVELDNRSRIADLENVSLTFNKADDFDFIGKDSAIESLDMQKAISDMQKDQVLQQYQYFVGNPLNIITDSSDGLVIQK